MTAAGRLVDVKSGKPVFQKNHNEFSGLGRVLKKAYAGIGILATYWMFDRLSGAFV